MAIVQSVQGILSMKLRARRKHLEHSQFQKIPDALLLNSMCASDSFVPSRLGVKAVRIDPKVAAASLRRCVEEVSSRHRVDES